MSKSEARPPSHIIEKILGVRGGDERALEDIVLYYQDRIAAYMAARVGRGSADFDDLCQLVFVKMALSLPRLRSADVFEAWLFRIASNVCRDHFRRLRLRAVFVPLSRSHETIPAREASRVELGDLAGAMEKLPPSQRELINLMCTRECSYEELAGFTKSSVRAVAGRLFRARRCLRKLLGDDGAGK